MSLIYITGPSGAGKSTVRKELQKRGYEAHDTDEDGMSAWYNIETGEQVQRPGPPVRPADWYEHHAYRMSPERVKALAERAKDKVIFLCGIPSNDLELAEYYDKVICLVIDEETMRHRVANRDTNTFGKSPDELQLMLYWHGKMLERYEKHGAAMINAMKPISEVVDEILSRIGQEHASAKPFQVAVGGIPLTFLPIPGGTFHMGSTKEEIQHAIEEFPHLEAAWFEKEYPQHEVDVSAFYMAETQITNRQWQIFMDASNISRTPEGFETSSPDCPVWGITFDELTQFCEWLSKESGQTISIPTEEQWEKAARGTDSREYPWGNTFDKSRCNTKESGIGHSTLVGSFPNGKSPHGILDMAGNVEEWTSTKYQPYPGGKPIHDRFGGPGDYNVIRGGSFDHEGDLARCARRHGGPYEHSIVGGRLVIQSVGWKTK